MQRGKQTDGKKGKKMEKNFKMTKALVSVPVAMPVLICAMMLMTDTAAAATKYQVASPFMLQGAYRADYGQDGNERVALAGGYYWTEWGGNPAASKLYYSKTEDGAGTLIGKTANTDSLIRNLDARILTNGSKFITQWKAEEKRNFASRQQDRYLLRQRQWQQSKAGQNDQSKSRTGKIELVNIYGGKLYYRVNYSVYGDYSRRTPL